MVIIVIIVFPGGSPMSSSERKGDRGWARELRPGVYNVPYNFIIFPTSIFLILIFFPKFSFLLPLFPTWYSYHRLNIIGKMIWLPPSFPFTLYSSPQSFPSSQLKILPEQKQELYTPLSRYSPTAASSRYAIPNSDPQGCIFSLSTGWPVIHGRVFIVPCKTWLVQCTLLYSSVSIVIRYKNNTAMFIWLGCTTLAIKPLMKFSTHTIYLYKSVREWRVPCCTFWGRGVLWIEKSILKKVIHNVLSVEKINILEKYIPLHRPHQNLHLRRGIRPELEAVWPLPGDLLPPRRLRAGRVQRNYIRLRTDRDRENLHDGGSTIRLQ